jgi:hypothetical protein
MNPAAHIIAASALLMATASAQGDRSLTYSEPPILLAQGISLPVPEDLLMPQRRVQDDTVLQEQTLLMRTTIQSLTESLALANSEAEVFKRQAADLSLRLETLGIPGLDKNPSKVEQRLLAAVNDLRLLKEKNDAAVGQLVRLSEAIQVLIKSTEGVDPQIRMTVETELRKTNEILGAASATKTTASEPTLTDGMVIDVKDDMSLVIANIGSRQGVRIGMPFQIWRESKRIGMVRVIDVRERISGAIVQSLDNEKETIKSGDRLRVDAKQ